MDKGPPRSPEDDHLLHAMVAALGELRDAWTLLSLALHDLQALSASPQRDQTLQAVRHYLDAVQDAVKQDSAKLHQIPKHFHDDLE